MKFMIPSIFSFIINMQNLQIKYQKSSAQLQYLEQYNLIEEDDIHRHEMEDFGQCFEEFQFKEVYKEQSVSDTSVSYEEFVENIANIKHFQPLQSYSTVLIRLLNVMLGDLLEYSYFLNNHASLKLLQFLSCWKWALIIQGFVIFLAIVIFSYQFIIVFLLIIWLAVKKQAKCLSQAIKSKSFKQSYATLINTLKLAYLNNRIQKNFAQTNLNHNVDKFVKQLQRKYGISLNETTFIIDKISEIFYLIHEKIRENNFVNLFLQSQSLVKRKYYYSRLRLQNENLSNILSVFESILKQFSMNKLKKHLKAAKPVNNKKIYFRILLKEFQCLSNRNKQENNSPQMNRQLLKIMKRQIEFKRILKMHQQSSNQSKININDKDYEETCQVLPFSQSKKAQTDSYYYVDGTLVKYEPEKLEVIRQNLNQLLKMKQGKQEKASKLRQQAKHQHKQTPQKPQKSIFSFGIPLLPPKRDMSAYYIE